MRTILLVDDEVIIVNAFGEILSRFGYRVVGKTDCGSALSIVREGTKVDLIITDYQMPGMDGLEFIARIKQMVPSVPVIMMTGSSSIDCSMKAVSLGAFACVAKPIRAKELGTIVKAALEGEEAGQPESR